MKILGCVLALMGLSCALAYGFAFPGVLLTIVLFYGAFSCFTKPKKSGTARTGHGGSGYDGRVQGDVIDLGNGNSFDSRNPDAVVDGVNWHADSQGGYYNSATGETIEYNSGSYEYNDGHDE